MKELTHEIPKPMLKVQGKPILEHILLGLIEVGLREIIIVTGFHAEKVESYFTDGRKWGCTISYARQQVQNGTGKAPEVAMDFVGPDPFFLTYGDILVTTDTYQKMLNRWKEGEFSGLVTVTGSEDVTKGGLVFFDEMFCLAHLVEKPTGYQLEQLRRDGWLKAGQPVWYNAGIYIFKPVLFDFTRKLRKSPRGEYELTDALISMISDHHRVAGLKIEGRWVDVRDPEVLGALERET